MPTNKNQVTPSSCDCIKNMQSENGDESADFIRTRPIENEEIALPASVDISATELQQLGPVQIVDIRNPAEVAVEPLPCEHLHIPMDHLLNHPHLLDREKAYLLVCAAGVRTQYTANAFRAAGYNKVFSLVGGSRALTER